MKYYHLIILLCILLIQVASIGQTPINSANFTYENCGCLGKLNLEIYNGLYTDFGGQVVPENDEESKGAITIANLNDTDGDGIIDKDDTVITASAKGRDEVDLMKLIISKSGTFIPQCKMVKIQTNDFIELWDESTKINKSSRLYNLDDLPKTIWVEATEHSSSLRDIKIEAIINSNVMDVVNATAIWVNKKNIYKDKLVTPFLSSLGVDEQSLVDWASNYGAAEDGSWYGFGDYYGQPTGYEIPNTDCFFGGRILFEFEIFPNAISSELSNYGIVIDITRRIERNNEYLNFNNIKPKLEQIPFPTQNEESNDDKANGDEDLIPLLDEFFSYDAPSEPIIASARAFSIRRLNFEEFVRVSFGNGFSGNSQEGSRCSEKVKWNLNYGLKSTGTYDNLDPYFPNKQRLLVTSGGLSITTPRRLIGTGNGEIDLSLTSAPTDFSYFLQMNSSGDNWELSVRKSNGWQLIGTSTILSSDSWEINISPLKISIINNGSNSFKAEDVFVFSIWELPNTLNSLNLN